MVDEVAAAGLARKEGIVMVSGQMMCCSSTPSSFGVTVRKEQFN